MPNEVFEALGREQRNSQIRFFIDKLELRGDSMIGKEAIREKIMGLGADICGFGGIERFAEAPENFRPQICMQIVNL